MLLVPALALFFFLVLGAASIFMLTRAEHRSALSTSATSIANDPVVRRAAEAGDADAEFKLGEALLQDQSRSAGALVSAAQWFKMAAENGNTEAMVMLSRLARTGLGVEHKFGQSLTWLQMAAARGNPEGMLELGRLYRDGVGVEKDPVQAYFWINRAETILNADVLHEREALARTLSVEEMKEAQNLSLAHILERRSTR